MIYRGAPLWQKVGIGVMQLTRATGSAAALSTPCRSLTGLRLPRDRQIPNHYNWLSPMPVSAAPTCSRLANCQLNRKRQEQSYQPKLGMLPVTHPQARASKIPWVQNLDAEVLGLLDLYKNSSYILSASMLRFRDRLNRRMSPWLQWPATELGISRVARTGVEFAVPNPGEDRIRRNEGGVVS